jgi:Spy/CpxP family protein refolding chaperone
MKPAPFRTLISAGLLLCASSTFAQQPAPDSGGSGRHGASRAGRPQAGAFLRGLNLTPEQKQKIQPLLRDQALKARGLFHDNSLSEEERFARLRDLRQQTRSQILPLLTPEQQQKLAEREKNRPPRGGAQPGRARQF